MWKNAFFEKDLLPLQSIALARFVTDIHHPLRSYHDPFPGTQLFSVSLTRQNVKEVVELGGDKRLGARITEMVSLFRSKSHSSQARLEATTATSYELDKWETVFRAACTVAETRKWLEGVIEDGNDVYFIVGYRTFVDGELERLANSSAGVGIALRAPVTALVEANLTPGLSLGTTLDPSTDVSLGDTGKAAQSFGVSGEAVYAIEYCKVSFKWYSSKTIEKSFLGQTCWKVSWSVRGSESQDESDVVEAVLGDYEGDDVEWAGDNGNRRV